MMQVIPQSLGRTLKNMFSSEKTVAKDATKTTQRQTRVQRYAGQVRVGRVSQKPVDYNGIGYLLKRTNSTSPYFGVCALVNTPSEGYRVSINHYIPGQSGYATDTYHGRTQELTEKEAAMVSAELLLRRQQDRLFRYERFALWTHNNTVLLVEPSMRQVVHTNIAYAQAHGIEIVDIRENA